MPGYDLLTAAGSHRPVPVHTIKELNVVLVNILNTVFKAYDNAISCVIEITN